MYVPVTQSYFSISQVRRTRGADWWINDKRGKMSSATTLLEFKISTETLKNPVDSQTIQQDISSSLKKYGLDQSHSFSLSPENGFMTTYLSKEGSYATVRGFKSGLITIDINEYILDGLEVFTEEVKSELQNKISESLGPKAKSNSLPAIKRGAEFPVYFPTVDNKLIEYDFTELLFEADSPYQNIKIYKSQQFGGMLILDDDPNLAESDLIYTQTILGVPEEKYDGKTVLILGGGDGGALNEVLKYNPKMVTMVDIDKIVVEAAPKYLRGICGDTLDSLTGDNYEVLTEDCVPILQDYIKEGRTFDFVINDLTAVPCTTEPVGEIWDFLRLILDLSMKVMAPDGRYYTQGNGANAVNSLKMYEQQLAKLCVPVEFTTKKVFVPSYHEFWVFYKIFKTGAK